MKYLRHLKRQNRSVQKEILDEFTKEVEKSTQKINIGEDPLLEEMRMGPLSWINVKKKKKKC